MVWRFDVVAVLRPSFLTADSGLLCLPGFVFSGHIFLFLATTVFATNPKGFVEFVPPEK